MERLLVFLETTVQFLRDLGFLWPGKSILCICIVFLVLLFLLDRPSPILGFARQDGDLLS